VGVRAITKDSGGVTSRIRKSIVYSLAFLFVASLSLRAPWAQTGSPDDEEANRHLATKGLVVRKPYEPITPTERAQWLVNSTVGPESLMAGVLSSGISTATNEPAEYGPTWGGFGERFGMRLTGVSTGNAIEAGLGAIWGEDPRYDRLPGAPFDIRVRNVVKLTFTARYHDGHLGPAYARLIAIPGNNVLSNAWRARSATYTEDVVLRTILGILGRMAGNAFVEFWPDVRRRILPARD
jgi:hypothetical protein